MQCPQCGFENPPGMRFCGQCAGPLKNSCPECGFQNPPGFSFCGQCGSSLRRDDARSSTTGLHRIFGGPGAEHPPRTIVPTPLVEGRPGERTPDGERRTITALFADIKGSMEMMEDLDPEEARTIVDPLLRLMMDAVQRYEGYVAQSLGDGIFALFGAPLAQEDHPHRAMYAALRMQDEARRYAEQLRLRKGVTVQIRVGINTGDVVLRSIRKDDHHADYVPVGHSTGLAARAEALAAPGTIVVTEHTKHMSEGFFLFESLGRAHIKGVTAPLELFEVRGIGPLRTRLQVAARKGLVRFVGRLREMEQLRRALASADAGKGQVVAIVGEAGMGKSRLCHEFKLVAPPAHLILETFSVSHGRALPYLPLIDLLRGYFGIGHGDDDRQKREKITGKVLTLDRTLEETLPFLFWLMGAHPSETVVREMDPRLRRHRTFETVKRLLIRESLNQPLIIIFEDLHWLDRETEEFLGHFLDGIATSRILLVVNYRPEYAHGWGSKTFYSQIRLDPLGADHARELLRCLLGEGDGPAELQQFILAKTEGNPFFIEEIVQSLFEQGILERRPSVVMTKPLSAVRLPPTVQGVLLARIDRLESDARALLQTLAVLGKQFSLSLLRRVVVLEDEELDRLLDRLQAAEFVFEQPSFPDTEYVFKHALTQEVAYRSLVAERRSVLHDCMGRAMEDLFVDRLDEFYNELAHHFGLSGNTEKAAEYLRRAGSQALSKSAFPQAITQLSRAIELLEGLPDMRERRVEIATTRHDLATAQMAALGYGAPEVGDELEKARLLAQSAGDAVLVGRLVLATAIHRLIAGDILASRELGSELMAIGELHGVEDLTVSGHLLLGIASYYLFQPEAARVHLETFLMLFTAGRDETPTFIPGQDPLVVAMSFLSVVMFSLGYVDSALRQSEKALARARELGQPFTIALALSNLAQIRYGRGDLAGGLETVNELLAISVEYQLLFWHAIAEFMIGVATCAQGDLQGGARYLEQANEKFYRSRSVLGRWGGLAHLALLHAKQGNRDEAMRLAERAKEEAREAGILDRAPELERMVAHIHHALYPDDRAGAERIYRSALVKARQSGARAAELKVGLDLARLLRSAGRRREAHETLSPIVAWFTEGGGTKDVAEARQLLGDLAADAGPHPEREGRPR